MRKQLLRIIQEAESDIKQLEFMVQPARNANNADGKIVVDSFLWLAGML